MPESTKHKRLLGKAIDAAYGAAESLRVIEETYPDSPVVGVIEFATLKIGIRDIIDLEEEAENAE